MPRGFVAVIVGLLGLTTLLGGGFFQFRRDYDETMFVSQPRDSATMREALGAAFGNRVKLLQVPVVNRDVNGIAGLVGDGSPKGLFRTKAHVFSFERLNGRDVCLMTLELWELGDLRRTFLARFQEAL